MAVLNFPSSPVNNQIHTENGVSYRYSTSFGAWLISPAATVGSVVINSEEIDFGSIAVKEKKFAFANANATSNSVVIATHSFKAATGKSGDENEADTLVLSATANAGYIIIHARAVPGPVIGKFKINYYLG